GELTIFRIVAYTIGKRSGKGKFKTFFRQVHIQDIHGCSALVADFLNAFSAHPGIGCFSHIQALPIRTESQAVVAFGESGRVQKVKARTLKRSEEHTSELQSRENLVCRLLLEKKKTY